MRESPCSLLLTALLFTGYIFLYISADMESPDQIISSNYSLRWVISQKLEEFRAVNKTDEYFRKNSETTRKNPSHDVGNLDFNNTTSRRAPTTGWQAVTTDSKRRDLLSAPTKRKKTNQKEVVTVVLYDKIKGYLNWLQDWFLLAARENCSTTCIVTEDKKYVRIYQFSVVRWILNGVKRQAE